MSRHFAIRLAWPILARSAWVLVAMLILLLIAASIPFEYAYYKSLCLSACTTHTISQPLTLEALQALQALGLSSGFYAAYSITLEVLATLVYAIVGAVIFWHRSDERMGLFAAFTLLTVGCAIFIARSLTLHGPALSLPAACANFMGQASFLVFFYVFPDGRFVPRWTRWLAVGSSAWWAVSTFIPDIPLSFNGPAFLAYIPSVVVVQIYRYWRVSNPIQRQQTKWVVYGFAMAIVGLVGVAAVHDLVLAPQRLNPLVQMLASGAITGFLLLIPVSIGMAIVRSHLWDIDVLIRRTVVYSTLTLALGMVYIGCIVVSRALVAPIVGGSEAAIAASTLAIAALFTPLRRRIQSLIDRRFYRRKYDAAKVLAAFGATARDETELERLSAEMLRVVDETMQPEFVGLWLRDTAARSTPDRPPSDSPSPW